MSHTPHELAEDFPDAGEKIHILKTTDAHFARLMDDYHEINRAVHRAETRTEVISDEAEAELRRRRVHLKDQISQALAQA